MNAFGVWACLLAMVLWVGGCGDHDHDHDVPPAGNGAVKTDDHGHGHGHDHGHSHSHEPEMKETLGLETVGPYEVVAVQNSKLRPGGEMHFDVEILGDPQPPAVRFWIGSEAGEGSAKADPAHEKDRVYHVDVNLPAELPDGSRLWVEIDRAGAEPLRASFELKS